MDNESSFCVQTKISHGLTQIYTDKIVRQGAPLRARRRPCLKSFLRPVNVPRDLGFQFFERTKFLLIAELFADFDFQFLAIKVAGKIKQVRLDPKLWVWVLQRRAMADV